MVTDAVTLEHLNGWHADVQLYNVASLARARPAKWNILHF